jgi:hypothetical protein
VPLGIHPPLGRVGVAPFRADGHLPGRELTLLEPGGEEGLRLAVGAGGVEVPDPCFVRGVEESMCAPLHDRELRSSGEVVAVADVDVPGPAERRQAESEPAHRQAGPAQRAKAGVVRHVRLMKSIETGTPSRPKRSRSWFSTQ